MYLSHHQRRQRSGVILLVVLVMLTLFAIVGLSFVLYSESEATASRIYRESFDRSRFIEFPTDPERDCNRALGELIYDVPDSAEGVFNSVRGHSLARSLYGWNYRYTTAGDPSTMVGNNNTVPFSGLGWDARNGTSPSPVAGGAITNAQQIHFRYFTGDTQIADPERTLPRPINTSSPAAIRAGLNVDPTSIANNLFVGKNAPYTYPDRNNLFLAAVKMTPAGPQVMAPSFHRPELFGPLTAGNPNWTNVQGKYMTLRPRTTDHNPAFPMPSDSGGDVKNIEGAPGGNDAIWVDFGAPVYTWEGVHYKPLFAWTIIDADSRINLNTAGNLRGSSGSNHASNHGIGPWEVNPFTAMGSATQLALFRGNAGIYGRYGLHTAAQPQDFWGVTGNQFAPATHPLGTIDPQHYAPSPSLATTPGGAAFSSRFDFDANATISLTLPAAQTTLPSYGTDYGNGAVPANEALHATLIHPALVDPYRLMSAPPGNPMNNRIFHVSEAFRLSSFWGAISDTTYRDNSDLARLLPGLLDPLSAATASARWHTTAISNDLDRPGFTPMQTGSGSRLTFGAGLYPTATPIPTPTAPVAAGTEFMGTNDFRWNSQHGPIALNRPLTDYRTNPNQPFEAPGNVQIPGRGTIAQFERQQFAQDIFIRLCLATGTYINLNSYPFNLNPIWNFNNAAPAPIAPNPTALPDPSLVDSYRWLAQLAVNIVDYIDNDDIQTPFHWDPVTHPNEILFGVEQQRLVINEVLARVEDDPTDPGHTMMPPRATRHIIRLYTELHNPLTGNSSGNEVSFQGQAPLTYNSRAVYRMLITRTNSNLIGSTAAARQNVLGTPDNPNAPHVLSTVTELAPTTTPTNVPLSNGAPSRAAGNQSFWVVGPTANVPGMTTGEAVSHQSAAMQYNLDLADPAQYWQDISGTKQPLPPTIMLQRLANPFRDEDNNPTSPTYNPYITIDFVELNQSQILDADARTHNSNAMIATPKPADQQHSYGRWEPRAGLAALLMQQAIMPPPAMGDLNHTFFAHNAGASTRFEWVPHLDRMPMNVAELLSVAGCKPHEFTHRAFGGTLPTPIPHQHLAPWQDQSTRLYRALELLRIQPWTIGSPFGGRVAGRVNINTIFDDRNLRALSDGMPNNHFRPHESALWNTFLTTRTPGLAANQVQHTDLVKWSFAAPWTGPTDGLNRTLLNPAFDSPAAASLHNHPWIRDEFRGKIANNMTTRSNVFYAWCTVGYFRVVSYDPNNPIQDVRLGGELYNEVLGDLRAKFFMVIDRTNLTISPTNPRRQGERPVFFALQHVVGAGMPNEIRVPATGGSSASVTVVYDDEEHTIRPGDRLYIGIGPDPVTNPSSTAEVTPITSVSYDSVNRIATIRFNQTKYHPYGSPICTQQIGNPGPQTTFSYNIAPYTKVVPFFGRIF